MNASPIVHLYYKMKINVSCFLQSELKVKYEMHISLHIKHHLYDNYKILKCKINMSQRPTMVLMLFYGCSEMIELLAKWGKSQIQCHGESHDQKFCIYYASSMYLADT